MSHFNKYQLNANYTTDDGINLINPTFEIAEFFFYCENDLFQLVLHWTDENHDFKRFLDINFTTSEFPTLEFIENQLLQVPEFSNSTIINE